MQDGWAAEAAVGDEHFLAEALATDGGDHFGGDSGEVAVVLAVFGGEGQGNQRGTALAQLEPKLLCQFVAEGGGAHLGDREASGGDDEGGSVEFAIAGGDDELVCALHSPHAGRGEDVHMRGATFFLEQGDDFAGGAVAEQLAQRFLVVGDAVLFDEGDEVLRGVAGQRGFAEVRVRRKGSFRGGNAGW